MAFLNKMYNFVNDKGLEKAYVSKNVRFFCTLTSLALLFTGGMIYVIYRPKVLLLFFVADKVGVGEWVDSLRATCGSINWPEWIVYCLPNGLWSWSYVIIIEALFCNRPFSERCLWVSVIPVIGIFSELMQCMGLLRGTYDFADLLFYFSAIIPIILFENSKRKKLYGQTTKRQNH